MAKKILVDHSQGGSSSSSRSTRIATPDHNQNISWSTPFAIIPTDLLFQGETLAVANFDPDNNSIATKFWLADVFIFRQHFNTLMLIRVVQLLCVNLVTLILPFMAAVRESVYKLPIWILYIVCVLHSLLFVIEEGTLYEFPFTRRKEQLYYAISISLVYVVCESYTTLVVAVMYINQFVTCIILAFSTVIYLANHWYRTVKATEQALLESSTRVNFNGVTRPETLDTRLNIGPQLVFPIPEEFAMPGDPDASYYVQSLT